MLKRVPDDIKNAMFFRHETEDGQWEVGIYPVIFGFRIRAGEVGSPTVRLDMCIADSWLNMRSIFPIVCKIIEERGRVPDIHEWPHAKIRPVWKDDDFMAQLVLMSRDPESLDEYDIPNFRDIRESYLNSVIMNPYEQK